jgi:hypothetical protein
VDFGRKPAAGTAHATASTTFFSPLAAALASADRAPAPMPRR